MKTYEIHLDDSIADKFDIALQLTGETADEAIAKLAKRYLADTFNAAANSLRDANDPVMQDNQQTPPPPMKRTARRSPNPPPPPRVRARVQQEQQPEERESIFSEWGKAINRIPRWAKNPQQYNHKILRAFFELQKEIGKVTIDALRNRCSDPAEHPDTFVPHFDNNFTQMKFDNGNSHGKVFEENDGVITLWDKINDTLMRYRDYFM